MTDLDLKTIFEHARDVAAQLFARNGEVSPMWHAMSGDNTHFLVPTPWGTDDEKDAMIAALEVMFKEQKVVCFAFICEAWVVQMETNASEVELHSRPSEHPNRREVLQISAEDKDGNAMMGHFFILRPEHGPPTLSDFHLVDGIVSGRLTGLLTLSKEKLH